MCFVMKKKKISSNQLQHRINDFHPNVIIYGIDIVGYYCILLEFISSLYIHWYVVSLIYSDLLVI